MIVKPSFRVYLYSLIALIPDSVKKYTPYRYLSAFSFSKVITSLWHRQAIPENAGKFVGCLGALKDKNTKKIKTIHVIYAEKGST
jgi:hypothetical protein